MPDYDKGENIRKLRARTYEDAKRQLFDLYKYDYSITDKRQVLSGGFLGVLGQKEEVEVSYIVKNRAPNAALSYTAAAPHVPAQPYYGERDAADSFIKNRDELLKKSTESSALQIQQVKNLEKTMEKMRDEFGSRLKELAESSSKVHPSIERIENLLADNEFTVSYIKTITDKMKKTFSLEELNDFDLVQRTVVDWIGESIAIAEDKTRRKPHVVIIVGPTGVGKTTTLVKLAAQQYLKKQKESIHFNFCFITTDTMRVGAVEQLDRFSTLFDKKVMKAESAEDVKKLYEDYRDKVDAIFIDTSGYSPNDANHIADMKNMLDVRGLNSDVYLALMASTKARDLKKIMQNYEPFGYQSVIITKCDESDQYGNVISVLSERHKSVSYLTDGQNVAKTLSRANVVDFLIRLENFKIDRIHIEDKFGAQ
ncbi:MAG: GTP-binding protein [Treponema sp.]